MKVSNTKKVSFIHCVIYENLSLNGYKKGFSYYWNRYRKIISCKKKAFKYHIYWPKQLKDQPVLLLSSFVHNTSINEHKNMKLRENTCYRMI